MVTDMDTESHQLSSAQLALALQRCLESFFSLALLFNLVFRLNDIVIDSEKTNQTIGDLATLRFHFVLACLIDQSRLSTSFALLITMPLTRQIVYHSLSASIPPNKLIHDPPHQPTQMLRTPRVCTHNQPHARAC